MLAYLVAEDAEHALRLCEGVTEIAGLGHTSAVYARDDRVVDEFSRRIRTGRSLVNCPTALGAMGNPRAPMIAELEELLDQAWAGW